MSRPTKCKRICKEPNCLLFGPLKNRCTESTIIMSFEEYEVIRLMDVENLNQQESAEHMNTSRASVQRLYDCARKKLAHAFIYGINLQVEGGNYSICNGENKDHCGKNCLKSCTQEEQ